ncbi:hypothetical protein [Sphaerisporangium perillae]|uniref:hypothetical protein n=1 Tax=Sphaerisporangium perillae TaxID=2935860 RepID=UPI00200E836D|nr:hypothetical protein [Sphaerisporangium perillae]
MRAREVFIVLFVFALGAGAVAVGVGVYGRGESSGERRPLAAITRHSVPDSTKLWFPHSPSGKARKFTRRADGGTFASPRDILIVVNDLRINCEEVVHSTVNEFHTARCNTGTAHVMFYTVDPGYKLPRSLTQDLSGGYRVRGRNWLLIADDDPRFGEAVAKHIGGKVISS